MIKRLINKIYNKLKYVPNRKASENMKQKLTELKRETDKSTIIVEYLTLFSQLLIDRTNM